MNYQKEYKSLVKDIKDKLLKLSLSDTRMNKYLNALTEIEANINGKNTEFAYYEAFLKAMKIEQELTKLIHNKKDIVLSPYESVSHIDDEIKIIRTDLKKYQTKNKLLKLRIISCVLTGSVLLTAGAYTIGREKNRPNEKLYLTETYTYRDDLDKEKYESIYQKENEDMSLVTIKKITPWTLVDDKYQRSEYTYRINNMSYDEIISSKDYEKIIANLRFSEEVVTKTIDEMQNIYMYEEPIFEVSEVVQDKDSYIERRPTISIETILALFSELLIYILMLDINNGPLFEAILIGSRDIKSIEDITSSKKATLKVLKKQKKIIKEMTF